MANPTTNFGWVMPTATDLVTDLPADFAVFGQGVDTSMQYLLGGTTGQILSKTSGTNMAFTWINNDQGDITGVTAGTGISGGGTSGTVTVSIDTAVTVDKTTAQTLTNKTLTTPIISSISNTGTLTLPTSTDTLVGRATTDTLTNKTISATSNTLTGVINNTLTSTTGDVIYASAANTPARLGIGSTSQVLTVAGGVPTWATPAGGGGMTLISSTVPSAATSVNFSSISGSYKHLLVLWTAIQTSSTGVWDFRFNNSSGANYFASYISNAGTTLSSINMFDGTSTTDPSAPLFDVGDSQTSHATGARGYLWIYNYSDSTYDKMYVGGSYYYSGAVGQAYVTEVKGLWDSASAITSVDIVKLSGSGTMTAATRGIIRLYGVS